MTDNMKQTIMPFIRLACMLISSGATIVGFTVDADSLFIFATSAIALVSIIWGWWKNSNVTKAAKEAQEFLDLMKANDFRRSEEDEWFDEDEEVVEEVEE